MINDLISNSRSHVDHFSEQHICRDNKSNSILTHAVDSIRNDPDAQRVEQKFLASPFTDENIHAIRVTVCEGYLPHKFSIANISEENKSVKTLLGLIARNIEDEQDKIILEKVCRTLDEAGGDTTKEQKVGEDLKCLIVKYGNDSLADYFTIFLDACLCAWKEHHPSEKTTNLDEVFSSGLQRCSNVVGGLIEKMSTPPSNLTLIVQDFDNFLNSCESSIHTLLNFNNKTPDNKTPGNKAPDNKAPDNQAPDNQAPDNQAPGPKGDSSREAGTVVNVNVNAIGNGNSSPAPTEQNLICFLMKLLDNPLEMANEEVIKLINKGLDVLANGILQNLQSITQAQHVMPDESVSANPRQAPVVQPPETMAAEKPAGIADSESLRMSAEQRQSPPLANNTDATDSTEMDSAAVSSTAIASEIITGTQRQDLNRMAERNREAPEIKEKTNTPEKSETPEKLVKTAQAELVAESLSGPSNNISVAIKQPSDSLAHPRDGTGIHSGGSPNNPLYSGSKDSRTDERDIFADNQPVYGGSGSYVQQTIDKLKKEFVKGTPFGSVRSISGNNSQSGAERHFHQQNTTKDNRANITDNSSRIYTTNRSFDPLNQRRIPSVNYVQQFSQRNTEKNKDKSHNSKNNIGEVVLDNQEMQYERFR